MTPAELLLSKLPDAKRNGRGWQARCPAHDDRRPSLSIAEGDDGLALVRCHAGCSAEDVVAALDLTMADLMADRKAAQKPKVQSRRRASPKVLYPTAHEAVADLERRHGPRSAWWTYVDAEGGPVGVMVRWDLDEIDPETGKPKKDIRPVAKAGGGWIIGAMPDPRPLYGLPELADAQRVYVTEGEKAADVTRSLGLTATTSSGGSNAPHKTDWTPLAGKDVVILPDNDLPGRKYAETVAGILAELAPPPVVKVVKLPGLPPRGDIVEFIAARRAAGLDDEAVRAEIEALADGAEPVEVERPEPSVEAYRPFPVEALPEPIRGFVNDGAKAIGCDPSYVALPMLSALAAAIGNARRIELKRGWTEPAIIWTGIVGESGTAKTPAFKLVIGPIRDRQGKAMKRHAEEMAEYELEYAYYEKGLTAWRRDKATCDDPPAKPDPPEAERFVVSDTTVEALAPLLLANPRGLLLARDELAGWIGSFDRYAGGKTGTDAAHWLSMHNGECIVVDRKTGRPRTIYVPQASVSVTGGIQPGILNRALGVEHRESGLAARLLLACPPRRPKRWTEADIDPEAEAAIAAIFDGLYGLQPNVSEDGDPIPVIVSLTPDGKRAWVEFYDAHAKEQADLTGDLSAAWSKLEGYAARLALVIHFVRLAAGDVTLATADAIDEVSIAAGVGLSRWFGREARRMYAMLGESAEDRDRRRLVELIRRKGGSATVRDLMRSSRLFKTAPDAEHALGKLVKAGIGRWERDDHGGGRGVRLGISSLLTPLTLTEMGRTLGKLGIVSTSTPSTGLMTTGGNYDDHDACACCCAAGRVDPPRRRTASPRGSAPVSTAIRDDGRPGREGRGPQGRPAGHPSGGRGDACGHPPKPSGPADP